MFKKILVANRGEIAVRIMRACRELNVATVAVYSEADSHAVFNLYAEESYPLGGSAPAETYLNIGKILDIAKRCGAEAIHPGYGFLAENPRFARACEKEGLTFIGPSSETIALMGNKLAARELMIKNGVPVVPGTGEVADLDTAMAVSSDIGYPVLIKAAAGGGGIGMRVVETERELPEALAAAQSTAASAFGDGTVYVERYLRHPHHIEFQIFADKHGNYVHLGERECSVQRRHQKVIEESPSAVVTPELRQAMGEAALKVARGAQYVNSGTVEFLLSGKDFYFLEMNTRIQVEHPVTEMVTGVDLVKEQINVAAGFPLSFTQEDIVQNGWAIECRICAEDPLTNFTPAPGTIRRYRSPGGVGVRVDSGVHMGYPIPSEYDSLISKLAVWGRDRDEAIQRMRRALFEYVIVGVVTNIPFCKAVIENEDFQGGDYSTRFIEEHPSLFHDVERIMEERSLGGIFGSLKDNRKVAAISAAINAYLDIEQTT